MVAFQAVQQEMNITRMRKEIVLNTQDVKKKEEEIISSKMAMQKLSSELSPLDQQKNELTKQKEDLVKDKETSEQNINTCQTEKVKKITK